MFIRLVHFSLVFLCGYLVIKWILIPHPYALTDFFVGIVINPLQFFAAAIALFIGILISGGVIHGIINKTIKTRKKQSSWSILMLLEYCGFGFVFFLLFYISWEETLIFFSLSLLYGMISVEN
ncbi:hypothetical protein PH210_10775 [Paenibacillus sp. BSR1-1]|uniref:hypothetical protein n=1 Tax=Paenibacillus sp. BSR1-1 TaxID=3020845 RepID=UPI0025AF1460|nr:hypothetical protein [Paenibacillus sp. BSR1-1]MDN3016677.1 hypothetical protein [Paenibacillus sp. BSR1-1]